MKNPNTKPFFKKVYAANKDKMKAKEIEILVPCGKEGRKTIALLRRCGVRLIANP